MEWDSVEVEINLKQGNDALNVIHVILHTIILILTPIIEINQ